VDINEMLAGSIKVWGIINPLSSWAINTRTVRYYQSIGLISYPTRKRRSSAIYSNDHIKELLRILILQRDGVSLNRIKDLKSIPMDKFLSIKGLNSQEIDKLIANLSVKAENILPKKEKAVEKETEVDAEQELHKSDLTPIEGSIINNLEFHKLKPHLYLGEFFAFVKDLPEDLRKTVHKALYGQKSKGETENAVIHLYKEQINLPGCSLEQKKTSEKKMAIVLQDKDIYEVGVDTAKVFILCKEKRGTKVIAKVCCDSLFLSESEINLDNNGCGMLLVPTLFPGLYSVEVEDQSCQFNSVSYGLSPFEVNVEESLVDGNKMTISLGVKSYQVNFSGTVTANLIEQVSESDGSEQWGKTNCIETKPAEVVDGKVKIEFDVSAAKGNLSIELSSAEDSELIASAPLRGSQKTDRDNTLASTMGNVVKVSLMPSLNSKSAKGLFFVNERTKNSPISLQSCIGKKPVLVFNKNTSGVIVSIVDFSSGEANTKELGNLQAGAKISIDIETDSVFLAVGAFVDGTPWEGKAVFIREDSGIQDFEIKAPEKVKPGEDVAIQIHSKEEASILVKVIDRRLRPQYDALTKAASSVKTWIYDLIGKSSFGFIAKNVEAAGYEWSNYTFLRGAYGSGAAYTYRSSAARGFEGWSVLTGGDRLKELQSHRLVSTQDMWQTEPVKFSGGLTGEGEGGGGSSWSLGNNYNAGVHSTYFVNDLDSAKAYLANTRLDPNTVITCGHGVSFDSIKESEVKTSGGIVAETKEELSPRESRADVIFCDLIKVKAGNPVLLKIKMPDVIGTFEVSTFYVTNNGSNWGQKEVSFSSEKCPCIYSFIPAMVHEEDVVDCKAVIVGASKSEISVLVNKEPVKFFARKVRSGIEIEWQAKPGVHCVSVKTKDGSDSIQTVVESPTSDVFICQEMRILKSGEKASVSGNVLSIKVLPGMQEEIKAMTEIVKDFGHLCCEQTSAKIMSACLSYAMGNETDRQNAKETIKTGEVRMLSMLTDKGFNMYPDMKSVNEHYSSCAARRLSNLGFMLKQGLSDDLRNSLKNMIENGKNVLSLHKKESYSKHEEAYYEGKKTVVTKEEMECNVDSIGYICEYAFLAANLIRSNDLENGLTIANKVAKAVSKYTGGHMHGTYEIIAYLHMLYELRNAGIVEGGIDSPKKVSVNGKKMTLNEAATVEDVQSVKSIDGAVAVRIVSSQSIPLDLEQNKSEMSIDIVCPNKMKETQDEFEERMENVLWDVRVRKGDKVKIKAKIKNYVVGDVLYMVLPNCLSIISGGALVKKLQIDFKGKEEIEIEAVATERTKAPQRWAGLVRNMYDPSRICSPGMISTTVC